MAACIRLLFALLLLAGTAAAAGTKPPPYQPPPCLRDDPRTPFKNLLQPSRCRTAVILVGTVWVNYLYRELIELTEGSKSLRVVHCAYLVSWTATGRKNVAFNYVDKSDITQRSVDGKTTTRSLDVTVVPNGGLKRSFASEYLPWPAKRFETTVRGVNGDWLTWMDFVPVPLVRTVTITRTSPDGTTTDGPTSRIPYGISGCGDRAYGLPWRDQRPVLVTFAGLSHTWDHPAKPCPPPTEGSAYRCLQESWEVKYRLRAVKSQQ